MNIDVATIQHSVTGTMQFSSANIALFHTYVYNVGGHYAFSFIFVCLRTVPRVYDLLNYILYNGIELHRISLNKL